MKLAQVTLAVPDEIYADVMKGALEIAGLVKDNKHIIRKHLPRVADSASENNTIKKVNVMQAIKNNKGIVIGIGVVAAIGSGIAYAVHSIKEGKKEKMEQCAASFQKALQGYLKATKNGKLTAKAVDTLLNSLEEVQNSKAGNTVMLAIPALQLNELINSIFDYTKRLGEANALDIQVKEPKYRTKDNITNLQTYLEIQKQIIEKVA